MCNDTAKWRHASAVMLLMVCSMCLAALLATRPADASEPECDQIRRAEQHARYLPDCRAYELVTPSAAAAVPTGLKSVSAATGDAFAWNTYYPPAGTTTGGTYFLSRRSESSGWSAPEALDPAQSSGTTPYFRCKPSINFSEGLEAGIMSDGFESIGLGGGSGPYCAHNVPSLFGEEEAEAIRSAGFQVEPERVQSLYRRDNETGAWAEVNLTPIGSTPGNATFEGGSRDLSHVFFEEEAKLTPDAPVGEGEDLYLSYGGTVHLVTYLPDGAATAGTLADGVRTPEREWTLRAAAAALHASSGSGSRAIFDAEGKLFLRVNAEREQSTLGPAHEAAVNGEQCAEPERACTIQINASVASGTGGGGTFLAADAEDTRIFFLDEASAELTADTVPGSGLNLYEYSLPAGAGTGTLTDLTPIGKAGSDGIAGVSEDGSVVYFVADGVLAAGATEGDCGAPVVYEGKAVGACNLYVRERSGTIHFVTRLSSSDRSDWGETFEEVPLSQEELKRHWFSQELGSRISDNGAHLAFNSIVSLGGYDNRDVTTGKPDEEIYLYSEGAAAPECASCNPSGARPTGSARITGLEQMSWEAGVGYLRHYVTDEGRLFFESPDALVSEDVNEASDVYEYYAGAPHLISSGLAPNGARFVDASVNGSDVFFITAQPLLRSVDVDNAPSLYDARVDGGFPEPAAASAPCGGAVECRGEGTGSAVFSTPPSAVFSGPGNLRRPASKSRALTRRQKLQRALRRCVRLHRHNPRKRKACKRRARKRYAARAGGASRGRHHGYRGARK